MNISQYPRGRTLAKPLSALLAIAAFALTALPGGAQAMPAFNRQTGQNCVACHAGGQFPELTPYGRLFKLTGYTIGQRAMPVSAMVVGSMSRISNPTGVLDPATGRNGEAVLATASLLLGGTPMPRRTRSRGSITATPMPTTSTSATPTASSATSGT
jgi:hypothetical protein